MILFISFFKSTRSYYQSQKHALLYFYQVLMNKTSTGVTKIQQSPLILVIYIRRKTFRKYKLDVKSIKTQSIVLMKIHLVSKIYLN